MHFMIKNYLALKDTEFSSALIALMASLLANAVSFAFVMLNLANPWVRSEEPRPALY